jgi:hypothetical protein
MTSDQELDRLERLARLFYERPWHHRRESRNQSARLGDYATALGEYDAARQALEEKPDDSETKETLNRAREILDQAREELKQSTRNATRRLPA